MSLRISRKELRYTYLHSIFFFIERSTECLRPYILPNVKFATNINSTIETGKTIALECKEGFRPTNNETDPSFILHCNNGVLHGRLPACESMTFNVSFAKMFLI